MLFFYTIDIFTKKKMICGWYIIILTASAFTMFRFDLLLCNRYQEGRSSSTAPGHLLQLGWTSCTCLLSWSSSSQTTKCPACWNCTQELLCLSGERYCLFQPNVQSSAMQKQMLHVIINQSVDENCLCVFGREIDASSISRQVDIFSLVEASGPGAGNQEWSSALQLCSRETYVRFIKGQKVLGVSCCPLTTPASLTHNSQDLVQFFISLFTLYICTAKEKSELTEKHFIL